MTYLVQNICLQAREGEKTQLKDGKSCRHTQRFARTQVAYQKLDGIVFNILNQTKMLFTALFVFLDSWTQVPQVFQVPQHSTRAVMAACVSILSLLMSFLFFAQLRAAVKSAVFGIGHSHRGRLDAVSQKLFVQSLRQILLQLCRKNGHLTIFSNAIWRKSKICVKCIDFKIFGSHLPKAGMLAGFLSSRHRDACDACDDFCRPLLVFFVKFRRSAIRRSRRGLLRLLSLSLGRSVMFI